MRTQATHEFTPYHCGYEGAKGDSSLTTFSTKSGKGFTLVEIIVSVALFAAVMLVSVSSLLALAEANRKAQALQAVMNNLNVSLDGMVRAIRMGADYHCVPAGAPVGDLTAARDCASGGAMFAFEAFENLSSDVKRADDQWVYWFENGKIYKSETGSTLNAFELTTPDVTIDEMAFYVIGTTRKDAVPPKVVITIKGTASPVNVRTRSSFTIQATAVQRLLDL